jgi:uncharacterized protein (TIGR03067 family)
MHRQPLLGTVVGVVSAFGVLIWIGSITRGTQGKAEPQKELEKLQGTWTHFSREEGGKQVVGEAKDLKMVITGDKWTLDSGRGAQAGTLKIVDAASTPKKLNLVITSGPNKGLTILAVYQVDADVFKYCGNVKARPISLQTKLADGSYCSSFKRLTK